MRIVVLLVLVFIAATLFATSNRDPVIVRFLGLSFYAGPLSLALVGSALIGALLTFVASLMLQAGLRERIHELDQKVREQNERLTHLPTWAQPRSAPKPPEDTHPP